MRRNGWYLAALGLLGVGIGATGTAGVNPAPAATRAIAPATSSTRAPARANGAATARTPAARREYRTAGSGAGDNAGQVNRSQRQRRRMWRQAGLSSRHRRPGKP